MRHRSRKTTIAMLLVASLALHGIIGELQRTPFIIPEEEQIEAPQEVKDKDGKKKRVLR